MLEYELQKIRHAQLIEEADLRRLAKQVRRARRQGLWSAEDESGAGVRSLRHLFDRAA